MRDSTVALLVLACVVALFVSNRVPAEAVALSTPVALWATGLLPLSGALGGFGDPVVVFVAALFVVAEALDDTGVTGWAGQELIRRVGTGGTRLLVALLGLCALLTTLVSINGSVAALLPLTAVLALRLGVPASRMMIPLAFAGSAGSLLALTGSPVNVILAEVSEEAGGGGFGFFSFAVVGAPLVVVTVVLCAALGSRLLPTRQAGTAVPDLSAHAETLARDYGLPLTDPSPDAGRPGAERLIDADTGIAEIVVPPRSELLGEEVSAGRPGPAGLTVLGVRRLGRDRGDRPTRLEVGDALLVRGPWPLVEGLADSRSVMLVDAPTLLRRHAAVLGSRAWRALAVTLGMVALLVTGAVPPAVAGLVAALALVLLRVLTADHALRSVSWSTVVLIGGLIPLSAAIGESGAADMAATRLVDLLGGGSPYVVAAGLFLLTAALGQVVSNMATALVVAPIAVSLADETSISVQPLLMVVTVASAAALLTPIATPANMMIMGPGGYRFGDYWRLGLPVLAAWMAVSMLVIPLVWPF